ncbi:MAG TPA: sugar ABC transporter ATP-binding protein [Fimbriimonadales bacterium]|nr:sugar ABC transporter ATP-binding protein [Fimbriimonadales bacterium]
MPGIEVRSIVKDFPAVRALDDVSVRFAQGEVHGIIGENGAGKSTLMRILGGLESPTSGEIYIESNGKTQRVEFRNVRDSLRHGIAMIHQELNLVDDLTIAENVFLGTEPTKGGILQRARMHDATKHLLDRIGANFEPYIEVGKLSIAEKQLVEIAKALTYDASTLIMDEPTSVLSERETKNLFSLIKNLKSRGVSVIYISHRLAEVEEICDRITVLRDGKHIRTFPKGELTQTEMANLMVGRPLSDMFPTKVPFEKTRPALSVRALLGEGMREPVDFEIFPGEILGLAGLIGAGRTELAETIFGIRCILSGEISRHEARCAIRTAKDAMQNKIAYVSEDRKEKGLILNMDVVENITLANLSAYAKPILRFSEERKAAKEWTEKLDIRVPNLHAPVLYLSGGNQQKTSLAKWLDTKPEVLILDEPTRGVDIGAKREIYEIIHRLASEGMACILISSEMQELIGLCHRVLVMRGGRIVKELRGDDISESAIMTAAVGIEA